MSPLLEKNRNLNPGTYKFVRVGEEVGYDDPSLKHHKIAKREGLELDGLLVDDAGFITRSNDSVIIGGESTILETIDDPSFARYVTAGIVEDITNLVVEIE